MRTKKIQNKYEEPKTVYEFKYDYLIDDIIAFADEFVFYEEELTDSVYSLIMQLMDDDKGRFNGTISLDLDYIVDSWSPYDNQELFLETFTDEIMFLIFIYQKNVILCQMYHKIRLKN
jgi:hypothetical protein